MPQTTYSPSTAKGRKTIANLIESLAASYYGTTVEVTHGWPEGSGSPDTLVRVTLGDATVGIDVGPLEATNGYIVPWNIVGDSDRRFSPAFGAAVGAEVNPFHRRKCMGAYPPDSGILLYRIDRALACIADGEAFEK